ncbi:hypothetical protein Tsubulata_021191 [Turnera subulata]|uniref:Receptor-like serine/threonine-protein kinase n=1 Tax=Turnera subulata TaxID=218843 RepID=A0A9Q0JQ61_9ROSI|nr:hypothetical protein Tsubulata_021191 [Turnera subulata]
MALHYMLCVLFAFCLYHAAATEIPLTSRISVKENNSWVSTNGNFAVGFFEHSDQPGMYGVGIRFSSKTIPVGQQIVVWVAGADVTVSDKSYFQLSQDGELVLVDSSKGFIAWTSKTGGLAVVSAVIGDDGNLVLLNGKKDVVWQSFDTPADSLLPGQNLTVGRTLRAASRNSVSSYYSLQMNARGLLQLKWESNVSYWSSQIPSSVNLTAIFTSHGALQLVDQNLKPFWSVYGEDHNDTVNFRFLRLDIDGNLRMYSWVEALQSWRSVWQAVENQCNVFATCGERGSICLFNASGSPECKCLSKNTSSSPNLKCFPQTCKFDSVVVTYEHTYLYGIYPPNDSINRTSLLQCKKLCKENPLCTASTFINDGSAQCLIKTTPYFSGHSDSSISSVSFVKECVAPSLAVDPNKSRSPPSQSPVKRSRRLCIHCLLIGVASCTGAIYVLVHLAVGYFVYRRIMIWKKAASSSHGDNSKGFLLLSFAEIKGITKDFKDPIRGNMFKGVLPNYQTVMVEKIQTTISNRKFRAIVSKIGSIHHRNLVKLVGYCNELEHRILVYEFARNGHLEKVLEFDELSKNLTWRKRVEICLGVAKAVCYMHTGCREFLSHGNLNCGDIILGKKFEAKVSQFWWGLVNAGELHGGEKDVEDFGKILLTVLTGNTRLEGTCQWTYDQWFHGHPEAVVDKRIHDEVDRQELDRILRITFWCLQKDARMRPKMDEVLRVLEGTQMVDPPPPPFA